MAEPAEVIIREGFETKARLGTFGLDLEVIMDVIRQGEIARAQFTDYDPLTAGGYDAYRYRVRALREAYCPKGWLLARPCGVELIVSPDKERSIMTKGGNHGVGIRTANPQPNEIGAGTTAACEGTLLLFDPRWVQVQGRERPTHETWMLLVYSRPAPGPDAPPGAPPGVIRAELSFGTEIENNRVARWFERLILPELDPNDLAPKRYDNLEPDESAFDVPVLRKKRA